MQGIGSEVTDECGKFGEASGCRSRGFELHGTGALELRLIGFRV
jgi:hypothetical protein